MDYNSTTPIDPEVLEVIPPYLRDEYDNPSSYIYGQKAHETILLAHDKRVRYSS